MRICTRSRSSLAIATALLLPACGSDNSALLDDAAYEQEAIVDVKTLIQESLDAFANAAAALHDAAPEPDADGWSAQRDPAAVSAMKAEWKKARQEYERVEGAIAVLFPELDVSTDGRYDDLVERNLDDPDDNLFDGEGFTGVHAIERVLWADAIPAPVVAFESALPTYVAPAFPATEEEAKDFKDGLCGRLVADAKEMQAKFRDELALGAESAYRGVIGSIEEQAEKVAFAETGQEESRYAQHTLGDMRANVDGGLKTYLAFQKWLLTKDRGDIIDQAILSGFERLNGIYIVLKGDALPAVPEGWSSEDITPAHRDTEFGKLFVIVQRESDPDAKGSLVQEMSASADLLGIKTLP